jgi:aldehyde:ferredoxin oxidoreductase
MGAEPLKAIAIRGTGHVEVADPPALNRLGRN